MLDKPVLSLTEDERKQVIREIMEEKEILTEENVEEARDFLHVAASAIGERAASRDVSAERSMEACVKAFNHMYRKNLTETEGWMFMVMLKMSRAKGGDFRADDYIDLCGYAALAGECAKKDFPTF